jgi:hypothetical protein
MSKIKYTVGNLHFEWSDGNEIMIYRGKARYPFEAYNVWDYEVNTRMIPYTREALVDYVDAQLAEVSL